MRSEPIWIDPDLAIAIHERICERLDLRFSPLDKPQLIAALARPKRWLLSRERDLMVIAAGYALGVRALSRDIPARTGLGFVLAATFLELNGWQVVARESDVKAVATELAADTMGDRQYANWLRQHTRTVG